MVINLGPLILVGAFIPAYLLLSAILSRLCCFRRIRGYFTGVLKNTFFNSAIVFIEGVLLIVAVCSLINFYQVFDGKYSLNGSYYASIALISILVLYAVALLVFLCHKFDRLETAAI